MTDIRRQTVGDLVSFLKTLEQDKPIEVIGYYTESEIAGAFIYDKFIQLLPESFDDEEMINSSSVTFERVKYD